MGGDDEKSRVFLEDLNREKRSVVLKYSASFGELLQWLKIPKEDLNFSNVDVTLRKVRHRIKDRFKGFNAAVTRIHTMLSNCTIPDSTLRGKILQPLTKEIVEKDKYILFTSEELQKKLNQFFSKHSD